MCPHRAHSLQRLLSLLPHLGVRVSGCLAKFFGGGIQLSALCQHSAQVEMCAAKIRTNADGFAILNLRGIEVSSFFKKPSQHLVCFRQIWVGFQRCLKVRLRLIHAVHASQRHSVSELVDWLVTRPVIMPHGFSQLIPGRQKIREIGMRQGEGRLNAQGCA